ncbi:MAG TPA: cardiolipin synthase [Phycisphaerae bacterium]|nr:cardiolipin synthase [Phycisphaerae bacterium]
MVPPIVWTILSIANYVVVILLIEHIVRTRRDPRGALVWILTLILLPVLGLVLYLLVGQAPIMRKVRRRRRRLRKIQRALSQQTAVLAQAYDAREKEAIQGPQRDLIHVAARVSDAVVTRGNNVAIYHDAERAFLALSLAIQEARAHVHMEYYIFAEDDTGLALRDLLVRKAREGAEVRVLLDAVGCWRLGQPFVDSMREGGVKVAFFLPWGLTHRRLQLNCRNHRKLTVIDGRRAFSGSKNIADEYLGRKKKYGPWLDTHLEVSGPCVAQLQEVFVEDWHFATKEDLSSGHYFPTPIVEGDKIVQIVPSGPDRREGVMHQLLNAAVNSARHSVSLLTAYFVPDATMVLALTSAAFRGVRVQVLLPSRSDHWVVLWAGRAIYEDLLDAGVEIYEYDKGMLHAKEMIVDSHWAMVGSANMDIRSFRINFELTSMLYDEESARRLQGDFDALRDAARRVTLHEVKHWTYPQSLAAGFGRLAAPLL